MRTLITAILLGSAILADSAAGQAPTLELVRLNGDAEVLSQEALEEIGMLEVTVDEGGPATYRGPSVRTLATRAGAPSGQALRGPAMAMALVAEGADGYVVVFTVAELDEQFGAREAMVAVSRNGSPIGGDDGPLRIVVPEDGLHARWVRGVVRLRLVDLGQASERTPAR